MEDLLPILMFLLFVGASIVGRMKKAQGPRPPFDPRVKPVVVEEEESDPFEDPWEMPAKPAPVTAPEPTLATAQAPAPVKEIRRRPTRERQALDSTRSRFAEFRSSFEVDQPVEVEDLSDEGAPGAVFFRNEQDLAQAVVMSEVLSKPRALRKHRL